MVPGFREASEGVKACHGRAALRAVRPAVAGCQVHRRPLEHLRLRAAWQPHHHSAPDVQGRARAHPELEPVAAARWRVGWRVPEDLVDGLGAQHVPVNRGLQLQQEVVKVGGGGQQGIVSPLQAQAHVKRCAAASQPASQPARPPAPQPACPLALPAASVQAALCARVEAPLHSARLWDPGTRRPSAAAAERSLSERWDCTEAAPGAAHAQASSKASQADIPGPAPPAPPATPPKPGLKER